jgi:hypothetical protein
MTPENYAEWLRRQGLRVLRTESSFWVEAGAHIYQAFPYHWIIQPSELEIKEFLVRERIIGLRYSTSFDADQGKVSYHAVLENNSYNLEFLSSNSRSKVRRGLKRCRIEPITLYVLAKDGWKLREDTLERQGRIKCMNQPAWRRICLAAEGLPGFEAWGAFVESDLAATILTAQVENVCYMLYPQSHRKYFGEYVNNALSFEVTREMLSKRGVKEVFYGLHSLDAPASVDEFKFRMGYTAKPVRQRVVFHPWLRPLFNSASHTVLKAGLRLNPGNPTLSKVEGILRFYLQGRLPISRQTLPPPLALVKGRASLQQPFGGLFSNE